jgi:outer membrane protein OmpU
MKRILLASSALVMSAGFAAAEVTVGGDGRMGVQSLDGADVTFSSRVRISFTASGETDNGLSFGGSIRADNSGGGAAGTGGNVYVDGPFGKLTLGDTDTAAKAAVGQAGGVGYTGLGDKNEIGTYLGGKTTPNALWSYSIGDLSLYASADNTADDPLLSGAMGYSIGDVGVGVGVERQGDMQNVVASVDATLGDASVKVVVGSGDNNEDHYGASASFASGPATFTAFASSNGGGDHFGIGAAYDLGGGAAIKGGFADGDSLTGGPSFDLGITLGF